MASSTTTQHPPEIAVVQTCNTPNRCWSTRTAASIRPSPGSTGHQTTAGNQTQLGNTWKYTKNDHTCAFRCENHRTGESSRKPNEGTECQGRAPTVCTRTCTVSITSFCPSIWLLLLRSGCRHGGPTLTANLGEESLLFEPLWFLAFLCNFRILAAQFFQHLQSVDLVHTNQSRTFQPHLQTARCASINFWLPSAVLCWSAFRRPVFTDLLKLEHMETVEKKNCEGKDQANQILNIRLEESCLSFFSSDHKVVLQRGQGWNSKLDSHAGTFMKAADIDL